MPLKTPVLFPRTIQFSNSVPCLRNEDGGPKRCRTRLHHAPVCGDFEHAPCFFTHGRLSIKRDNRWSQRCARKKLCRLNQACKYETKTIVLQSITMCFAFRADRIIVWARRNSNNVLRIQVHDFVTRYASASSKQVWRKRFIYCDWRSAMAELRKYRSANGPTRTIPRS